MLADTQPPMPAQPGRPLRRDYEYRREGTRNLFLACEPLAGWRQVAVTERRTMQDFAHQMRWLVDEAYPEVEVVRVVLDNLNTHRLASLYETFPAPEARRIAKRLEFHYTPKAFSHPVKPGGRQLAEHGGDRVQRAIPLLSEAATPRRGIAPTGSRGLGAGAKRGAGHHQLAVQDSGCPNQIAPPLSLRFQT